MKVLSLLFFLSIFSFTTFSQTPFSKGTLNINGNLSLSSQTFDNLEADHNVLTLNPQIGYFFFPNFSFNALFQYNRISNGNSSTINWGIGPSVRYYFNTKSIIPFLSLSYLYTESKFSINDDNSTGNSFIFAGGLDYFITKNVAVETIVSYSINNETFPDSYRIFFLKLDRKSNTFKIGIGINFFLH